ncbi:MAG: DNA polymerase III, partial [Chloroflexota bacterium]|nr:DNA polymerase III [Chloroflexota bacterium]
RLDLKDAHVQRARELGVRLAVSTDSHRADHLGLMRFGVGVARRGWCQAEHLLNSRPLAELAAFLGHRN